MPMPVTRVRGVVKEGDRLVTGGWIEFIPADGTVGNLRSARVRADGTFDADGVAVGTNAIRLVNAPIASPSDVPLFARLGWASLARTEGGRLGTKPPALLFIPFASPIRRVIEAGDPAPAGDRRRRGGARLPEGSEPGHGTDGGGRGGPMNATSADAISTTETTAPAGAVVRTIYRDGAGNLHIDWPTEKIPEAVRDAGGTLWVDLMTAKEEGTREIETWLQDVFPFHHLAVEDALKETNVPKVDDWGTYLYIVFRVPRVDPGTEILELHELDIFLGANYVVTFHVAPMEILESRALEHRPRPPGPAPPGPGPPPVPPARAGRRPVAGRHRGARRAGRRAPERDHRAAVAEGHPHDLPASSDPRSSSTRRSRPEREVLNRLAPTPTSPSARSTGFISATSTTISSGSTTSPKASAT